MNRYRWPWLFYGEARDLARTVPWSLKIGVFLLIAAFLISLHVLVILSAQAIEHNGGGWRGAASALIAALALLYLLNAAARRLSVGSAAVNPYPRRDCRALVVFLSTPDSLLGVHTIEEGYKTLGSATAEQILAHYAASPWRQPLAAIYKHLTEFSKGRLVQVIIIPSRDAPDFAQARLAELNKHGFCPDDPLANSQLARAAPDAARALARKRGTSRAAGHFRETVELLAKRIGADLDVIARVSPEYEKGVPFENAAELVAILQEAFRYAARKGIRRSDVLVDITSGNALCSAVGAAVSMDENQRFQYVSTVTGEVIPYDVEYVVRAD
jgi:hypothetical protein